MITPIEFESVAEYVISHSCNEITWEQWKKWHEEKTIQEAAERMEAQIKKEKECGEHYYLPMGKYSGASAMKCQWCGKEIN